MTKRLILAFVFLSWHLVACSNGDSGISSGLPDKPSAEEDSPGTETISEEMRVKITGEDLYISAKLDAKTDILYWFKKCMFNELFTFYRVGTIDNNMPTPATLPDASPTSLLNLAYSDNIGPFNITGYGWCGGNHPYLDEVTQTARNIGYRIYIDGKEIKTDLSTLTKEIKIEVINEIMNPSKADTSSGKTLLNEILCIETVNYSIYRNNIQVLVTHEFQNESPVTVQMYYGMQSMFDKETHTLTANGKYVDWTVQKDVSTFTKKEYPSFRRFIEKSANAYQSSYLFADGLGNHEEISDDDIIFIGNSSNKTYHKIIADREHKKGDIIHWSGVYTWFKSPVSDDDDLLCYEGVIDNKKVLFIDCKKSVDRTIQLPVDYTKKSFTIIEKSKSITITGLYQPSSGEILLGGRNIQSFSSDEYFELIGTVFQDPFLMAFSIEQNIACCDEEKIDHQRVKDCLKRAGLWEKIESLPKKEKTPYSKDLYADGVALSGAASWIEPLLW